MQKNTIENQLALLEDIAQGSEQSFATLYRYYARRLFLFLVKLTGTEEAAEDVIQNTFLSIWLNRDRLPQIENFTGYLFKTAGNHAYNWLAKNRSIQKLEKIVASQSPLPQDITSQEILFKEAHKLVSEAIEMLPDKRREIFKLYRDGGLKYNEIAEQLNISPSTVRNSVAMALESIRERLTKSGLYIFFILFFGWR